MIEAHVTSLELSKRLKELGVPQKSIYYWKFPSEDANRVLPNVYGDYKPSIITQKWKDNLGACIIQCSAFLSSELGELLPFSVEGNKLRIIRGETRNWHIWYGPPTEGIIAENLCEALAKMLIYLIEQKLVSPC